MDQFIIEYEDNGQGMKGHLEIPDNIHYRVELMNGEVQIKDNKPGKLKFIISLDLKNIFYEKV